MRGIRFAALLMAAALPAWAGGNGKSNGGNGYNAEVNQPGSSTGQPTVSVFISPGERQTILNYFQQHQAAYAGAKPLPPGIAKKIARGGTMPPGIAKRYFPPDLIAGLPARPGQQWMIVGTDVLLVQIATSVIVDLIQKVF